MFKKDVGKACKKNSVPCTECSVLRIDSCVQRTVCFVENPFLVNRILYTKFRVKISVYTYLFCLFYLELTTKSYMIYSHKPCSKSSKRYTKGCVQRTVCSIQKTTCRELWTVYKNRMFKFSRRVWKATYGKKMVLV